MVVSEVGTTVETKWARIDGLRVRCLAAGTGRVPPLLLLHGGGVDAADFSYRYTIEPLARRRPVLAFDWPGYGGSDNPNPRYDLAYYARFLSHLMDSLGIQRAALVGTSMGGGAALSFALRSPERVDKLVLVASYGLGKDVPYGRLGYLLVLAPLGVAQNRMRPAGGERRARRGSSSSLGPAYIELGVSLVSQERGGVGR